MYDSAQAPRYPGLSLGTRDAGFGEGIGRMGIGVSISQAPGDTRMVWSLWLEWREWRKNPKLGTRELESALCLWLLSNPEPLAVSFWASGPHPENKDHKSVFLNYGYTLESAGGTFKATKKLLTRHAQAPEILISLDWSRAQIKILRRINKVRSKHLGKIK